MVKDQLTMKESARAVSYLLYYCSLKLFSMRWALNIRIRSPAPYDAELTKIITGLVAQMELTAITVAAIYGVHTRNQLDDFGVVRYLVNDMYWIYLGNGYLDKREKITDEGFINDVGQQLRSMEALMRRLCGFIMKGEQTLEAPFTKIPKKQILSYKDYNALSISKIRYMEKMISREISRLTKVTTMDIN